MAERWADQSSLSTLDVYHRMRAASLCDANGASTLSALALDAKNNSYRVDVMSYREPMSEDAWRSFFVAHVGAQAIVFETANGQALHDSLSGKGENAVNLHYHFVLVAGWHPGARTLTQLPPGWWCADGDNWASGDVLQFYPDSVLAASRPCAAMAVYPRVKMEDQVGYRLNGDGTVTFTNGIHVLGGFSAEITQHGAPSTHSEPLQQEFYRGADTAILLWNTGEVWVWLGADGKVHRDRGSQIVQGFRSDAANAQKEVGQLNARVKELEAQLAAQSAPVPAPPDPAQVASESAIRALAVALAEVGKSGQ